MARNLPRVLSTAAKAAVTLLLLALLFRKVDYAATLRHLRDITPLTAVASLVVLNAGIALANTRWRIVLQSMGRTFTNWYLFRLNLIGQFFNQALPSTVGGDGMRVWLLYRDGCSFAEAFNSVLIDRISGFVVLGIMSLYGLPTLVERMFAIPKGQTIAGIAVIVISPVRCVLRFGARTHAHRQISRRPLCRANRHRHAVPRGATRRYRKNHTAVDRRPNLRLRGGLAHSCTTSARKCQSFGVMIVAPVVLLLLVLPISIAGWGLREGLFVIGFGLFNVPEDIALAASIVFGLITLAEGLIGGVFWIFQPAQSRRSPAAHPDRPRSRASSSARSERA